MTGFCCIRFPMENTLCEAVSLSRVVPDHLMGGELCIMLLHANGLS